MQSKLLAKQTLTRRSLVFGGASTMMMGLLAGRLYQLQVLRAEQYRTLAEGNRIKIQWIAPVRGALLDRNGLPLAVNEKNFRIFLDTETASTAERDLHAFANVIPLERARIAQIISQARAARFMRPVLVREHLTWEELSRFEFQRVDYPALFVDVGQVRTYPLGERASHLLGYMAAVDKHKEEDNENIKKLSRLPGFKIGKTGIEERVESHVQGTPGIKNVEVNVHGLSVRDLSVSEGKSGTTLRLTIDARLQEYASRRIQGESAAVVVMDVHRGDIVALASMPGYNPMNFSKGITTKYWNELQSNPRNPLMNKAIAGQYPPGSTYKVAMGLAALHANVMTPAQRVFCPGHFSLGNHSFACWKPKGHGSVNLVEALAQSCDVYFYTMAQRMGIDAMAWMSRELGLGKITGLGLIGEKAGIVPDERWKMARFNQPWQGGDTINVGIGQGYILTTPLQLAVMTARTVNGGYAVEPRLFSLDNTPPSWSKLDIQEKHRAVVMEGMHAVNNSPMGTAYAKRIMDTRYSMAGKTGTSQVRRIITHGQDQSKIPWEQRHHALFIGYTPAIDPKYAVSVIIEHGGGGSAAAAPVARDVLHTLMALEAGEEGPGLPKEIQALEEEADG